MTTTLESWWQMWRVLAMAPSADLAHVHAALLAAYAEPQRHYHSVQHLRECLALWPQLRHLSEHPGEVELALWLHDAIYDPPAHDNEARSAEWARRIALDAGAGTTVAQRVVDLVMATRHAGQPHSIDAQLLVDVDLAILGAPGARFDEYEQQIACEYAWVAPDAYRSGRTRVLQSFLARPRIYHSGPCFEQFEASARENLSRSIAALIT